MGDIEQHKKDIENKIVDRLISALNIDKITELDSSNIAKFVLERIDTIKNEGEMIQFLQQLADSWNIFIPIITMEEHESKRRIENEVAEGVLLLAQHGKVENAIKLAKSVTNSHT